MSCKLPRRLEEWSSWRQHREAARLAQHRQSAIRYAAQMAASGKRSPRSGGTKRRPPARPTRSIRSSVRSKRWRRSANTAAARFSVTASSRLASSSVAPTVPVRPACAISGIARHSDVMSDIPRRPFGRAGDRGRRPLRVVQEDGDARRRRGPQPARLPRAGRSPCLNMWNPASAGFDATLC